MLASFGIDIDDFIANNPEMYLNTIVIKDCNMSNDLMSRDVSQELKINLLKHLDSLFCNENKSTCVWVDDSLIIVDNEQPTGDKKTSSVVEIILKSYY